MAVVVVFSIVVIGVHWTFHAAQGNDLIEFDKAPQFKATFQVDINQASWPEIILLPGIGETTARMIVRERNRNGPFTSPKDLATRVHGVGPKMIEEIRPLLVSIDPQSP
ncbi:MAG: helix-hairpin-helix domain-containing protein [Planctomycetales bacterium]